MKGKDMSEMKASMKRLPKSREDRHDVLATTFTRTVHTVHVDLRDLLSQYDPTDEVVLMIETPSGRAKRVHVGGNFLTETIY
jgi:hypothetical protein